MWWIGFRFRDREQIISQTFPLIDLDGRTGVISVGLYLLTGQTCLNSRSCPSFLNDQGFTYASYELVGFT